MVEEQTLDRPWEELRAFLTSGDADGMYSYVSELAPADLNRAFLNLTFEERELVLAVLPPETSAELLESLPQDSAVDLVEGMDTETAVAIVAELTSDEQADVIKELDEEMAEAILAELPGGDADEARELAAYDTDRAGGLMMKEVFSFDSDASVRDALGAFVEEEELEEFRSQDPLVVDDDGHLVGMLTTRSLLLSPRTAMVSEISSPIASLYPDATLEELRDYFESYDVMSAPVVDEVGRVIGVVLRDTAMEAARERAESESLKRQGVMEDELRSMPIVLRARRRLSWLSINIVLNVIAASVIALNQETLAAVIALAVFLPIVSDMSGCSGNQAVAVSLRELALGVVKPIDIYSVLWKEAAVGLINGLALGLLIALVAWLWKGNPVLGLVVGGALMVNTVLAVVIGGSVPLLLKRFGSDPAVASGPILTTVTDMVGFFLVLTFAAVALPWLV